MIRRFTIVSVLAALLATVLVASTTSLPAAATSGSDFDPGNIISDAAFFDGEAMTTSQIQSFLIAKNSTCRNGWCLQNYSQATPSKTADKYCAAYAGSSSESVGSIIRNIGIACGVSQKVLLVLLQKEQSLVTGTTAWRTTSDYQSALNKATGFGCPDTAGCDPTYGSFFYQVYYAARQFQIYAANPTGYNYRAGRVNSILYNPSASCGRTDVFIVNQATAGLYNYTPYVPNAAALANLYGTGDPCSSYGNRNFWRLYSDWFGDPAVGANLMRSVSNATVYLVSGSTKYPIASLSVLASLAPLGNIGYVSDAYLTNLATGTLAGGAYRDEAGSIFILDRGYRLFFGSCDQLADFGYGCDASQYVQLTAAQASTFTVGPVIANVIGTVSGSRYHVADGARSEIANETLQVSSGLGTAMTVLNDSAIAHLPVVRPLAEEGLITRVSDSGGVSLLTATGHIDATASIATQTGLSARVNAQLTSASVALWGNHEGNTGTTVKDSAGQLYVLTASGKYTLSVTPGTSATDALSLPDALLATFPDIGAIDAGSFVIGPQGGTVYLVMADGLRPIASWESLLALAPNNVVNIITVDNSLITAMTVGPVALTSGTMMRSYDNATVYLINGVSSRIAFSSFVFPNEAGFTDFGFTTQERIAGYPLEPSVMTFGFTCGTDSYIAASGSLHKVDPGLANEYQMNYVALDSFTCARATFSTPASRFIRTADGTIWYLEGTTKKWINSMQRLEQLGGSASWINVHSSFANMYATVGPA